MSTKEAHFGVIQLTRIGDLVQTLQAARQFKAEHGNVKLSLIARRRFATGIHFLLETVFDNIYLFETSDFFGDKSLASAKDKTHEFISQITSEKFDVLLNFSFCKSSSYLTSLIPAKHKLGIQRNKKTEVVIEDKWSQFVYSNVMTDSNAPFSLVDIYRYMLGCKQNLVLDPDPNFDNRDNNIVLHPFASHKKKRWGTNKWNELIYKLVRENPEHKIHIVGADQDIEDANRIINSPALANYKDKIISHVGVGSIADTYQLLMNSKLFIGHDSMVAHLAAETLTPTIVLSLGTVRPYETTPYQNNVINLAPKNSCYPCTIQTKCDFLPCHNSINHQIVAAIGSELLERKELQLSRLKSKLSPFHFETVHIYQAEYMDYGLDLKEISHETTAVKDLFKEFYKVIWLYYLRGEEYNINIPQVSRDTAEKLNHYLSGTNYLYELYTFGMKYCNDIVNQAESTQPDINKIQERVNRIQEVDQLCIMTKQSYPLLSPIVDFFYVNKANSLGQNIVEISKNNLVNQYDASNLMSVIHDFVEKTISPHIVKNSVNKEV